MADKYNIVEQVLERVICDTVEITLIEVLVSHVDTATATTTYGVQVASLYRHFQRLDVAVAYFAVRAALLDQGK